ncbi:MBL fold metallo-hydrolase [Bailinhaonella thermotolerans]|uniref:MBL fold metallo-hydrolase n=1 Tax=Bailinhaonella thermotolerans TaxID=1070861 RepID=A0A3A4AYL2_9ACTN|nr:MBL fold metallo-hydrolase [Bailinhaonella thermotolerans]RJL24462.1 MBL fold metallo-hydrolase [Bailinhaonella thermotolerans]
MVEDGSLFFVGNATTVLRYGGFTVLTDPNFLRRGQRAYLGYGLTSRRLVDPAVRVDELPPLDVVVLSHLHGDHWDRVARRGLDPEVPVVTTPRAARRIHRQGFTRTRGLPTWSQHVLSTGDRVLRVTALPGRHAPGPARRLLPPVMGSMLEFGDTSGHVDLRVYVSGDTLMYDGVRRIAERYPHIDLALVHLGGTRLLGLLTVTMDAVQGTEWLRAVAPRHTVPIHHDDYTVFKSPLRDFLARAEDQGLAAGIRTLPRGHSLPLPPPR